MEEDIKGHVGPWFQILLRELYEKSEPWTVENSLFRTTVVSSGDFSWEYRLWDWYRTPLG